MAAKPKRKKSSGKTAKKAAAPRFAGLAATHSELDGIFEEHQHALLGTDFEKAHERLETYWKILRAHIRVEEEIILPAYIQRVGHVEGGTPEIFLAEHRQIEQHVHDLRRLLRKLKGKGKKTPKRSDVLALLDRETRFKSLMEHHDDRECSFLYPLLDKATSAAEREQAFSAIHRIEVHGG